MASGEINSDNRHGHNHVVVPIKTSFDTALEVQVVMGN